VTFIAVVIRHNVLGNQAKAVFFRQIVVWAGLWMAEL
jgi:hypothetical protein